MDDFDFSAWLAEQIRKHDMSQLQVAQYAKIQPSNITLYLHKDQIPSLKNFLAILKAFGLRMEIRDDSD